MTAFIWNSKAYKTDPWWQTSEQWLLMGLGFNWRGNERTFCGNGLCLDWDSGYPAVWCVPAKTDLTVHLWSTNVTNYKFYLQNLRNKKISNYWSW